MTGGARRRVWLFDLDDTLHDASGWVFPALKGAMNAYIQAELGLDEDAAAALREVRGTARAAGDDRDHFEERLAAAEALTRDLLAAGRDGVAVLHASSLEVVVFPRRQLSGGPRAA
jgi:FMN phosphatase YigB (HAD superfamily)